MAFRPLTENDCGQENALAKLSSHVTHDYTFLDNNSQLFPNSSDQLVEQFLQESRAIPQTFRMDDLMREMHEIESQKAALPPILASAVKDQLHETVRLDQYENAYVDVWNQISHEDKQRSNEPIWDHNLNNMLSPKVEREAEASNQNQLEVSEFFEFIKNEPHLNEYTNKSTTERMNETWSKILLDNTEATPLDEVWANEFDKTKDEEVTPSYWDKMLDDMEKTRNDDNIVHNWIDNFNAFYNIPQKEYEFSDDNPMLTLPNPIERGKQLLDEGDFPSAVLCFEAAVKQQPDNSEAWLLLGTTQAENEQDPSAIIALNKCIDIDPTNLTALMAAAVSYTNESYYNQACYMLLYWLKHNPKYADLVPSDINISRQVTSFLMPNQKLIQELYLKAAQRNPQNIDCEVQCGLGVLCNLTGEYDKAVDCFRTALLVKPNDARIWNRLGATLANGSKSEEAVQAYHQALNLAPGFIRARYNVGISCINLRAYKEAVEHFLIALTQQARGKDVLNSGMISQMSDTIWSTLMMCLSLMDLNELRPLVKNRNLNELNKYFKID